MRKPHIPKVSSCTLVLTVLLWAISSVHASQLTLPTVGPSDAALAGNTVALPVNATNALFHNPAQMSLLPNQISGGLLGIRFHPTYENNQGYDSRSRELPLVPNIAYVTDKFAPFQFGMGMYGSLGFTFNHDAEPENGVPNNFFTELVSISLAPSVSYSLAPNLHIGAAINPTYGRLRFKTPSPVGRIDIDVRGPGIFGTMGVLYQPTPKLNLALAYKTRGKIWMFGNARVNGGGDDATVYFNIPQNIKLGFAYHMTDRFTIVGQARWAQLSVFQDTRLRFDERTFLNRTAVGAAKDRWRVGVGAQYEIFDGIKLRGGFSYEPWAIKDRALSPSLPDNTDYLFPFGISIERGQWIVDFSGGITHTEKRRADVNENPFFAGRYSLDYPVFGFQVTRLLGPSGTEAADPDPMPTMSMASFRGYSDSARYSVTSPQRNQPSGRSSTTDIEEGEALLDVLIAKLSRNRCQVSPQSTSWRMLAQSDEERRSWCRRGSSLRPA